MTTEAKAIDLNQLLADILSGAETAVDVDFDISDELAERALAAGRHLNTVFEEEQQYLVDGEVVPDDVGRAQAFLMAGPEIAIVAMGARRAAEAYINAVETVARWMRAAGAARH